MLTGFQESCLASCPFTKLSRIKRFSDDVNLQELLGQRYEASLFTKGQDDETRVRDR